MLKITSCTFSKGHKIDFKARRTAIYEQNTTFTPLENPTQLKCSISFSSLH